jgi:hypothetical protein
LNIARITAALFLGAVLAWAVAPPDCHLVPGWEQKGPSRTYTTDDLYEYMDGNSEGYFIYGFVRMQGVTCTSGGDTFVIDISEFADPESAYGMFSANRDQRKPIEPIGMGGQIIPRRAVFVKDKYYVEIAAEPAKDHTPALKSFVAALEKRITGQTALPAALGWFPAEKLVPESVRLVPQSVLGIRILKRGYIAQYEIGKAFIIPEATPEAAAATIAKLRERIGQTEPVKLADEAFQGTDKYLNGMCVFRKGRFVAGYANLPPGADGKVLATTLAARIP